MKTVLSGQKIAFLVANGLKESDLICAQKTVQSLGADTRIISMDPGMVSSLNETGWGLNFAADRPLRESLAADYSAVIVPGGQRSIEKLRLTAHTKRFLRGFYDTQKPLCILGQAADLLEFAEIDRDNAGAHVLISEEADSALGEFLERSLLAEHAVAA